MCPRHYFFDPLKHQLPIGYLPTREGGAEVPGDAGVCTQSTYSMNKVNGKVLQWNLQTKDTYGSTILSRGCPLSEVKNVFALCGDLNFRDTDLSFVERLSLI